MNLWHSTQPTDCLSSLSLSLSLSLCALLPPSISHTAASVFSHPMFFLTILLCSLHTLFLVFLRVNFRCQAVHSLITALFSATIKNPCAISPCTLFPLYSATWEREGRWREPWVSVCVWKRGGGGGTKGGEESKGCRGREERIAETYDFFLWPSTMLDDSAAGRSWGCGPCSSHWYLVSLHVPSTPLHWSAEIS